MRKRKKTLGIFPDPVFLKWDMWVNLNSSHYEEKKTMKLNFLIGMVT